RRRYDPTPYLPALAGYVVGDSETSTRFLNDFRRTLGDLIADGKYATFAKYAHERGLGIHPESGGPHAAPIDALACLGHSDIPMGEFWARAGTHRVRDFERLFVKQAASAAHIYGRRIVLAESFTSIGPHWEEDPQSLKPEFDRVACEGLNLVMLHTFDCSPASMGVPGQAYFAGTHINPQVTWWRHADAFFGYLNRCQFLLQQGLPVADVLYFYGENVPSFVRLKRDDPAGVLPGYDYDVINVQALVERTEVINGRIVLPDGTSYAMLALPAGNCYSLRALEQIARLADGGALVVGDKPTRPIGLSATPADEARFRELADRLWSAGGATERAAVTGAAPREALQLRGVTPDFIFEAEADGTEIDYFHRRSAGADVYFLANRRDEPAAFEASFRMSGRQPELWDPVTGATADAGAFVQRGGRTRLPLRLPAGGSLFVVFRRPISTDARGAASRNDLAWEPKAEIRGPWRVAFDPAWDGPADVEFRTLSDWSQHAEPGIRYYSGTARYRTMFEMPADLPSAAARRPMVLSLGRVENVASATLNGKPLGVAWTEPFQVAATEALRPGRNELEIEVTNLWPNRLIGDQRRPRSERLTSTNITKFRGDSPLLPSGLLGPVQVLEAQGDLPTRTAAAAAPPGPAAER
ncbi:MAG TPA: glycosyl hydrolase, partial [Lacipirellulaceae bacterium]|nr:glycosyl hydrolase [Lacipirellulaceae bacterium]